MKTAIRDATETLRRFIELSLQDDPDLSPYFDPADPAPDAIGTMIVTLDTPQELEDHDSEGVSVWLYLLQREEFTLNRPPRRVARDRIERQPLPLRLHFMVTPIVSNTTRQNATSLEHLILGKVLQIFHDDPSLSGARLQGTLAGSGLSLAVRLESLSVEQISQVWDALDKPFQLCVSFEMSVVPIDSAIDPARVEPVDSLVSEPGVGTIPEPV
jgi:hypothetical protein